MARTDEEAKLQEKGKESNFSDGKSSKNEEDSVEIEKMFELSLKYDQKIITKQTFAFSPEVFMSVRAIPKHILQRILGEILDRVKPRATPRQKGMVDQLALLIDQPHFD